MRPLIGVTPLLDTKLDSYWMLPDYMQGIQRAGGMPVMLPFQHDPESIDQMVALCDGFVFTGGEDIDPAYYHTEREPVCGVSLPERDELETRLLRASLAADKPVRAICRELERKFNVRIDIRDPRLAEELFTCHFDETVGIQDVMSLLGETRKLTYSFEKNNIIIRSLKK